jgi:SAM-dependent methyltransferase
MPGPTVDFWQQRFASGSLPWDRGEPSPQLLDWLADGSLRAAGGRIAVPGCGAGHEVAALAAAGFQVTGIDYAPGAVSMARERLAAQARNAEVLRAEVVQADVLQWQPATPLDAVYEQTCLCALHPDQWVAYASQLRRWLRPGGSLFAMLMQAPREGASQGRIEGPPYHLDIHAVRALFPEPAWRWPAPPYPGVPHRQGWVELAVRLERGREPGPTPHA